MMAAQLRAAIGADGESQPQGLGEALKSVLPSSLVANAEPADKVTLKNRAGDSKSPYVRQHASNPVAWQLWGDEAIELARKENKLLFVSIGYSACHWCHVMERESFESVDVAAILNESFIPIKIDREERPDIDRIYMNFVQATTGSGGWPLNVFVTPDLHPVFGGTYWPGPQSSTTKFEEQVDFLGILDKLSTVWKEQEQRCRQDSKEILQQLKEFAAEGTFGDRKGQGEEGLDIELLEEAYSHFESTYDTQNGGFGGSPKFPTPAKLAFLLKIGQYPQVVRDVVGEQECENAENMAISTLRKMARGGIHDHIGNGFARYSVTADWSLPHFEKMLYDNAQLLHVYLDGFLLCRDPELLGTVYDIAKYLLNSLAHEEGGFYSSEDADSFYRKGDTEKREGAFYVWTRREFESVLGSEAEPILSAFFNVKNDGNVAAEKDAHDEFIDQNVLAIIASPSAIAQKLGLQEEEVVRIVKESKRKLLEHRDKERVRPALDDKIVVGWNGIAIGALARVAAVVKGFDPSRATSYLASATQAAEFIKNNLYDQTSKKLYRVWREGRGDAEAFADDYAYMIEGLIDLYESTFDEKWLQWADELQGSQISQFYDKTVGGFFSTAVDASHVILRLKEGMDSSEPSTNGVSAVNLYRLSSLLADDDYAAKAKESVTSFESEILQYPWLFASFMPAIAAGKLGVEGIVVTLASEEVEGTKGKEVEIEGGEAHSITKIKEFEKAPRGGLSTFIKMAKEGNDWLRGRNSLLTRFGLDGKGKVLICADGLCKEERDLSEDDKAPKPSTADQITTGSSEVSVVPTTATEKELDVKVGALAIKDLEGTLSTSETIPTIANADTSNEPAPAASITPAVTSVIKDVAQEDLIKSSDNPSANGAEKSTSPPILEKPL